MGKRKIDTEIITRDDLERMIAKEANFTIKDVKEIMWALEDILKDIVKNHKDLVVKELFSIRVIPIKPHIGFDAVNRVPINVPESYRIRMVPSKTLKHLVSIGAQYEENEDDKTPIL